MRVENVKIYDLEESLHASGYPLRTTTNWEETVEAALKRAKNLSRAADWVGAHDQFLTGILVSFDLRFSNKAWIEMERYIFKFFVSSQSTMHCATKFSLKEQCNRYVDSRIIDIVQGKINEYNRLSALKGQNEEAKQSLSKQKTELYLEILYNIPPGFELTLLSCSTSSSEKLSTRSDGKERFIFSLTVQSISVVSILLTSLWSEVEREHSESSS